DHRSCAASRADPDALRLSTLEALARLTLVAPQRLQRGPHPLPSPKSIDTTCGLEAARRESYPSRRRVFDESTVVDSRSIERPHCLLPGSFATDMPRRQDSEFSQRLADCSPGKLIFISSPSTHLMCLLISRRRASRLGHDLAGWNRPSNLHHRSDGERRSGRRVSELRTPPLDDAISA